MKTFVFAIFLSAYGVCMAQSPPLNPFFEKYRDDDRFTQVYISGKMLDLISQMDDDDSDYDEDDENVKETLQKLDGIWVLSMNNYEDEESGLKLGKGKNTAPEDALIAKDLYFEARGMINKDDYEELMTVREREEEFLILIKEKDAIISELILLGYETEECCDEDSFFILSLNGSIDLKGISSIGDALDIEELEQLEKLEE